MGGVGARHVSRGTFTATAYFGSPDQIQAKTMEAQRLMGKVFHLGVPVRWGVK
jgi:hypothetical protein